MVPVPVFIPAINKAVVIMDNKRILPYSAINRKVNAPPPYSMLKPDTSSDSPSAKSNGARFVSAKQVIIHIRKTGGIMNSSQIVWVFDMSARLNVLEKRRVVIMINAIETS